MTILKTKWRSQKGLNSRINWSRDGSRSSIHPFRNWSSSSDRHGVLRSSSSSKLSWSTGWSNHLYLFLETDFTTKLTLKRNDVSTVRRSCSSWNVKFVYALTYICTYLEKISGFLIDAQNNPIVLNIQLFRIITTTCFTLPCRLFYIVGQQVTLLD